VLSGARRHLFDRPGELGMPGRERLELEEELKSYVREHLAGYNVPRRVEFIEQLPKNAVGKTMKHVLRERFGSVFDELAHGGRGPLEA